MKAFRILVLTAAVILGTAGNNYGQVDSFYVSIWPEYDHEGILVIYNGTLGRNINLPHQVSFRIPDDVHNLLSMGTGEQPNETVQIEKGPGDIVTLDVRHRNFQLEYYAHPFSGSGRELDMDMELMFDVARDCRLYIQKPMAAEGFTTGFEEDDIQRDNHGLEYYMKILGPKEAGSMISIKASYSNPEGMLTMDVLRSMMGQMQGGTGMNQPEQAGSETIPGWIWTLIVVIVVGIIGLAVILKPSRAENTAASKKFCSSCGSPVKDAGAAYCGKCGARLK